MEVNILAVRQVLDGVETNLKQALHDNLTGITTFLLDNNHHLEKAIRSIQEANIELLMIR